MYYMPEEKGKLHPSAEHALEYVYEVIENDTEAVEVLLEPSDNAMHTACRTTLEKLQDGSKVTDLEVLGLAWYWAMGYYY